MIRVPLIPPRNPLSLYRGHILRTTMSSVVWRFFSETTSRPSNISISKIVHQEYGCGIRSVVEDNHAYSEGLRRSPEEYDEIYLASWEHTKWLVLSSSFFLFPSMFAFYHHLYFHSFLLCSTSIISANYWRKPTYSWRRTMDLLFSKISFSWFFLHGVFYIHSTPHLIFAVSNTCLFSSCFLLSSYYFYKDQDICGSEEIWSGVRRSLRHTEGGSRLRADPNTTNFKGSFATGEVWYKYHFLFHTLMTLEQYHILLHILL